MLLQQLYGYTVQPLRLVYGVSVTEDGHSWLIPFKPFQVTIHVGVPEIIVQDDNREVNVPRLPSLEQFVVLPDTRSEPEFESIGRKRMPMQETNVIDILRVPNLVNTANSETTLYN